MAAWRAGEETKAFFVDTLGAMKIVQEGVSLCLFLFLHVKNKISFYLLFPHRPGHIPRIVARPAPRRELSPAGCCFEESRKDSQFDGVLS